MAEPPPRPASTYRLQLHAGFGFADAAAIAGYLAALGVTHAYLSPILQAAPGSAHGYDVVDHHAISAELGGIDGFRSMAAELHRNGLGVVVDVVPNHMSIGAPQWLNLQFWSVLADGPGSPYAHWFDIDWAARDGRLLLPILAGPLADSAADLTIERDGAQHLGAAPGDAAPGRAAPGRTAPVGAGPGDGPVLRYFEHVLPLRPGTADLPLAELLAAQHYELANWRTAATELNWRRFFDITTLAGLQVQEPDVFAQTHGLLLELLADGLIDGLRIDHPDGLADPRGYLRQLATATGGAWVVAEKILTGDEQLPGDWTCAGTTGYDSLPSVGGLFTDPAGAAALTRAYVDFTGGSGSFGPVALAGRRAVTRGLLAAEVARLARLAARCGEPALSAVSPGDLTDLLAELLSPIDVYRTYVVPGEPPPAASVAVLTAAAREARDRLPGRLHEALDALTALLLEPLAGRTGAGDDASVAGTGEQGARAELAVRFQQTTGPVAAKGVEDTAFYRWSRLAARNEVGGDPGRLGVSPAEFHAFAARLARDWPATMTTLSTHDTKRGEDVRARLAVLAERPGEWAAEVARWHDRAVTLSAGRAGRLPEPDTEYLLWQTLAGAWPVDASRLTRYLRKAMREAKTTTSWTDPDDDYEVAVLALAEAVLADTGGPARPTDSAGTPADAGLAARIAAFVAGIDSDARVNSLGAKLVQLTMPGVPDVYQGCELGSFSLVDPDNRRQVDFARRRDLLALLDTTVLDGTGLDTAGPDTTGPDTTGPDDAGWLDGTRLAVTDLDWQKLLVTSRALRLRRDHPDWFTGSYEPLTARGPAADHVVAFARSGQVVTVATRLPAGLRRRGGWTDTVLPMPSQPGAQPRAWRDVLTETVHAGPGLVLSRLTERLPVALLVPEPVAKRPGQVF